MILLASLLAFLVFGLGLIVSVMANPAMVLLFASLASSVMAARYYNHAGFIAAMPVDTDARRSWSDAGKLYVRRAEIL